MENKKRLPLPIIIIAIIAIIALGVLAFTYKGQTGKTAVLSANDAGNKAIEYINKNILAGEGSASLKEITEESGLYKMLFSLNNQDETAYLTKDGQLLFPMVVNLTGNDQKTDQTTGEAPVKTCEEMKKADKAELTAFIVSQCPYGLQAQRILAEAIKSVPALKESIKVKYLGAITDGKITSMHGDNEAQENLLQICIREEQSAKYWDYVSCYIQAGDSAGCLKSTAIDQVKLKSCTNDAGKGLAYAKADFDAANQSSASGSPTLVQNGETVSEFWFGGRTADAIKTLVCCGFGAQPSFCSQTLTKDTAATSFSKTYAASQDSSANNNANCGN